MSAIWSWCNFVVSSLTSDKFWLPVNTTWSDLNNPPPGVLYPQLRHLLWLPIYTAAVFVVRMIVEGLVFRPLGKAMGMKAAAVQPCEPNPVLERAYRKEKRPNYQVMEKLAQETDLSLRKIERWFRKKRNLDKFSLLTKFTESGWRFFAYAFLQSYGIIVLRHESWLWDQRQCWIGYPQQNVSPPIFWYYMLELSFYTSAVIAIFVEVRRKDFWQMVIHHFATIMLISFSWVCNFVRIGTLVFLVHDVADPWMEIAKLMKYSKHDAASVVAFVVFSIIWIITRCYIYPKWLLYSVMFDTRAILPRFSSLHLFETLLLLLQVLHIIWTFLILKIPYRMLVQGTLADSRSDSEMEPETSPDGPGSPEHRNGATAYHKKKE